MKAVLVMTSMTAALCAGCGTVPDNDVITVCDVMVGSTSNDHVLPLNWTEFQVGAPVLASRLEANLSVPQPFELGGDCREIREDLHWLITSYEAEFGRDFSYQSRYAYAVAHPEEEIELAFSAERTWRHVK